MPARRQYDHRYLRPFAHPAQHRHAVGVGETKIEKDEVRGMSQDLGHAVSSGTRLGHTMALVLQGGPQEAPHGDVVLYDEHV